MVWVWSTTHCIPGAAAPVNPPTKRISLWASLTFLCFVFLGFPQLIQFVEEEGAIEARANETTVGGQLTRVRTVRNCGRGAVVVEQFLAPGAFSFHHRRLSTSSSSSSSSTWRSGDRAPFGRRRRRRRYQQWRHSHFQFQVYSSIRHQGIFAAIQMMSVT